MKIIFLTFFIYCIVVHNLFASQLMQCKTEKQSGLNFIGKDHKQILGFLGLDNFSIKLSRTRDKIIQNQIYWVLKVHWVFHLYSKPGDLVMTEKDNLL